MRNYKNIKVWQDSFALVTQIYDVTKQFPDDERFSLTAQVRRAAVSIPSNIAEGASRESESDFARFMEIALGSTFEVECQIMLAKELGYIQPELFIEQSDKIDEIKKMLSSFIRVLRSSKR